MSDPYDTLAPKKGKPMYKATLTFRDSYSDYVRTVEMEEQTEFYAVLAGTIQGNLSMGAALIGMDR